MPVSDWFELMPQTVTIAEFAGRDSYGKPMYGSAIPFRARITYGPVNVRTSTGNEVVARGVVWLGGTPVMSPEDQLVFPDGSIPPIVSVDRVEDEFGPHHVKVFFG